MYHPWSIIVSAAKLPTIYRTRLTPWATANRAAPAVLFWWNAITATRMTAIHARMPTDSTVPRAASAARPTGNEPPGKNAYPPAVCPSSVHNAGFTDSQSKRHAQQAEQSQHSRQASAAKGIQSCGESAGPVHSLSSGRFFPYAAGLRAPFWHCAAFRHPDGEVPSIPALPPQQGPQSPSYQFDTKLRRDVQSTQPGPVIGGHSLSRQLYQKRLSRKIFILYLIKQHSCQRQNTGHQCRSSMVFHPECKDRRQCQESPPAPEDFPPILRRTTELFRARAQFPSGWL